MKSDYDPQIQVLLFWVVIWYGTNVSEKHTAHIFTLKMNKKTAALKVRVYKEIAIAYFTVLSRHSIGDKRKVLPMLN
jgi:hypothetical protein